MASDLGTRIAEARARLGWTQAELGERLGVAQSSVARWETGAREPSVSSLRQIADALGVTMDALASAATMPAP